MKKLIIAMFLGLLASTAHTQIVTTTAPLKDALNKLVPAGWELFVRNEIPENRIVSWRPTADWRDALGQIAENHNLDIRLNANQKKIFVDPKPSVGGMAAPPLPKALPDVPTAQPNSRLENPKSNPRFTPDLVAEVKLATPAMPVSLPVQPQANPSQLIAVIPEPVAPIVPVVKVDTRMVLFPMSVKDVFEQVVRKHGYIPDWQINDKDEPYRISHEITVLGETLEADLTVLQKSFGAGRESPFLLDVARGNKVVIITERK